MRSLFALLMVVLFSSCIGDDVVEDYVMPEIRLLNAVSSIEEGTTYQFDFQFVNNIGQTESVSPEWTSDDPEILSIDPSGLASALAPGTTTIRLSYTDEFGEIARDQLPIEVGESTVVVGPTSRSGVVATTSSYDLSGAFTLTELPNGQLSLAFGDDYVADSALPGLYVYLSNNPNSSSGALEIGAVEVFQGAHAYTIAGAGISEYAYVLYFCKPFNVKVGHGDIEE